MKENRRKLGNVLFCFEKTIKQIRKKEKRKPSHLVSCWVIILILFYFFSPRLKLLIIDVCHLLWFLIDVNLSHNERKYEQNCVTWTFELFLEKWKYSVELSDRKEKREKEKENQQYIARSLRKNENKWLCLAANMIDTQWYKRQISYRSANDGDDHRCLFYGKFSTISHTKLERHSMHWHYSYFSPFVP